MARKKKLKKHQLAYSWLRVRPKLAAALFIIVLLILYLPLHSYRAYSDTQKFKQTKAAMDAVYADAVASLGRPDNVQSLKNCSKEGGINPKTICSISINFIYGLSAESQANEFISKIQTIVAKNGHFKATQKLSRALSDTLVFDSYSHNGMDKYSGPHHVDCSTKYTFDTPDEITLSLLDSSKHPFEVFFSCSSSSVKAIY